MPSYEYSQTSVKHVLSQQTCVNDKLEVVCSLPLLLSASFGVTGTNISFKTVSQSPQLY